MRTALIALVLASALVMISCSTGDDSNGSLVFSTATVTISSPSVSVPKIAQRVIVGDRTWYGDGEQVEGTGYTVDANIEADNITSNCYLSVNPQIDAPVNFLISITPHPNLPETVRPSSFRISKINGQNYSQTILDNSTALMNGSTIQKLFSLDSTDFSTEVASIPINLGNGNATTSGSRRPWNSYLGSGSTSTDLKITIVEELYGNSMEVNRTLDVFFNDLPDSGDCVATHQM